VRDDHPTPNFFLVGAPKCGTTALSAYLRQHPDVFMSFIKEPQFFAEEVLGELRAVRSWDDYLCCFAPATRERAVGEASVAYLGSDDAMRRIKAFQPAARIIVMLRNPIDVMYAEYSQRIYDAREPPVTFEDALRFEDAGGLSPWRRQNGTVRGLGLRDTVRFAEQVRSSFQIFGRDQVHVVLYDDLVRETTRVGQRVLRFLGVDSERPIALTVVNANKRVRSARLQRLLRRPPRLLRGLARATCPQSVRRFIGESVLRLNSPYEPRPPLEDALRRALERQLEPDVAALGVLLERDLSSWVSRP
jgi:hypothetical protein